VPPLVQALEGASRAAAWLPGPDPSGPVRGGSGTCPPSLRRVSVRTGLWRVEAM